MSQEWYLMNSLPVFNSGFEQEEFDDYAMSGFSELLNSPINNTIQIYNNSLKIWSDVKVIVQNNTAGSEQQSEFRQILSVIGTLKRGMYIKYRNDIWLVISHPDNNKIYDKAIIQKCNYTLPFQTNSSTIIQEPCIVESNQSSDGESSNKIITVPDNIKFILIQYNENTKKLVEDKRIIIDTVREKPMVYKITNIDTVTKMDGENGLWKLTCKADGSFNPETDNKDLKICNYISSTDIPTPPTPSIGDCCITYKNVATIKIGGTEKPFNVIYKDSNGIDITSTLTSVWSIQVPVGFENDIHFTPKDNLCGLRAEDNEDLIGKTITLNVKSSDGAYSGSLNVKVVSLYG